MFIFPWSNLHELNLDWILQQVKRLIESNDEFNEKADYAVETADEAKEIAEEAAAATIPDGSITTAKLADYAVTQNKLAVNAVGNYQLQDASVTTSKLYDGAVTTVKIADEAVTNDKLGGGAETVSLTTTDVDSLLVDNWLHDGYRYGGVKSLVLSFRITMPNDSDYHDVYSLPAAFKPFGSSGRELQVYNGSAKINVKAQNYSISIRNMQGSAITNEVFAIVFTYI